MYVLFLFKIALMYTQEQLHYAEINIQKGPLRFEGGDHAVGYSQVIKE